MSYLTFALAAGILASLLTRRPPAESIERFHALIRTPIHPGETLIRPCQLPKGVAPADRRRWFAGTDFEFPAPSRTSIVGFLLAWLAVGAMIGAFVWLIS